MMNISNKYTTVKPPSEKLLIQLQNAWLENKTPQTLEPFFSTLVSYAKSLTLKINKGKTYLEPSRVMEIAIDAVLKIFDRYDKDPLFRVESSFAGWVKYPILELLYGHKQKRLDKTFSLNSLVSSDNHQELLDFPKAFSFSPLSQVDYSHNIVSDIDDVYKIIVSVVNEAKSVLSYRLRLLFKIGLLLLIRRPKSRFIFSRFVKMFFSEQEEQTFEVFILELRNRIIESSQL